ncbi:MAG: hypothetical protein ACPGLV_06370 [Bacteroidia bacterium]
MSIISDKNKIHKKCIETLELRIRAAQNGINRLKDSMFNETKSSAGDKYETGREMMQSEISKAELQLAKNAKLLNTLKDINPSVTKNKIGPGVYAITNKGAFYFAAALGKLKIESNNIYVLGMNAPITQKLKGHKVGDKVNFNGVTYLIEGLA